MVELAPKPNQHSLPQVSKPSRDEVIAATQAKRNQEISQERLVIMRDIAEGKFSYLLKTERPRTVAEARAAIIARRAQSIITSEQS